MNDKQTLTLEAGKYYRTREGKKVFVAALNVFDDEKIHCVAVLTGNDGGDALQWYDIAGKFNHYDGDNGNRCDLVAEWVEPKRIKGWVNVSLENVSSPQFHSATSTHIFNTRELADRYADNVGPRVACIEIDVLEGHGLNGEAA